MLAEVLTQGRALGVIVLACVQDPRKEVIGLRGLFTQTIALRLRSADETRMVLGDGAAALAPAHCISPSTPGTAWVIEEDGSADRVRADFWPDDLVRDVATHHPAPYVPDTEAPGEAVHADLGSAADVEACDVRSGQSRKPRTPRQPRAPRRSQASVPSSAEAGSDEGPEAA